MELTKDELYLNTLQEDIHKLKDTTDYLNSMKNNLARQYNLKNNNSLIQNLRAIEFRLNK